MRIYLSFLFLVISQFALSQQLIHAIVKDSETKSALAFCNISLIGKNKGTITNIDGEFNITANPVL